MKTMGYDLPEGQQGTYQGAQVQKYDQYNGIKIPFM